ncbi:hypothetical protein M422DRAFT_167989 [Sphaerobolus stellatus SS14]|uniref:Major facilitator superfamily (MFS) profile domain-containing protein n=1 Tax=Sphaerobolus stellatus (strain SS14) TaxID=990650 RepID=A0A0C9UNS7_SPHS4|nr:hypothetical protein M422DRAFT_167989 [Sphaerobolus stellatus SS14]
MEATSIQSNTSYSIFSPRQRYTIVSLACFTGFLSPLSSLLYTPALPTIAADLGVSITKVNLTVTTYLIFQGITPSLWGTLGDMYGRRILYIITSTISAGACVGLSLTNSYAAVLILRALQATGTASTAALGAGLIRDLIPPKDHGGVLGIYSAGIGAGTAFGPFLGGILAQYIGWHGIFYFLLGLSLAISITVALLLPETLHSIVGNGSISAPRYLLPPIRWLCPKTDAAPLQRNIHSSRVVFAFVETLRLLTYVEVLCCVVFTGICYAVWQNSMVETSTIYAEQYHLTQLQIGLTYISNGMGALIGNIITGRVLNAEYERQLRRETTSSSSPNAPVEQIEKARLLSMSVIAPAFISAIIAFGWIIQSKTHIAVSITASFFIGCFDSGILTSFTTLMVDMFEEKASASTAIINLVRCLLGAAATSTIAPMIGVLNVGWSFTTLGLICVASLPMVWAQYRYGFNWRKRRQEKREKT